MTSSDAASYMQSVDTPAAILSGGRSSPEGLGDGEERTSGITTVCARRSASRKYAVHIGLSKNMARGHQDIVTGRYIASLKER